MSKTILVTGATGKQGGALLNALIKANADFEILALTRNASSTSAQELLNKSPKVKVIAGNLDAADEVFAKAREAAMGGGANAESEVRQGKALIEASIKNDVKHFVYSSVDRGGVKSDNNPTNVPHFQTKHKLEQHLVSMAKHGNMNWTVLRPVAFFENLVPGFFGKVFATSWQMALRENQKLQLVATSDISILAAEAFMNPSEYKSTKISVAGDELTFDQFKQTFEQEIGKSLPTTFHFIGAVINWLAKDLGYMFKWFRNEGYGADISKMKKINPQLKDFRTWLRK
ncbi:hypothetical protein B0O99DRAFT_661338 [Bisporella sp. PMI_857]|nr:hypothetical protein B0O99DRAFT_661338 [Bisporella sp. PMI_857]